VRLYWCNQAFSCPSFSSLPNSSPPISSPPFSSPANSTPAMLSIIFSDLHFPRPFLVVYHFPVLYIPVTPDRKETTIIYYLIKFYSYCKHVFTALHVMQTRYSEENSVRPSVCPSVRPSVTRVIPDKTEERSVQIFIPYERTFILVF